MSRIILVDAPESWAQFASAALEKAGKDVYSLTCDQFFGSTLASAMTQRDLLMLVSTRDQLPSSGLGPLFRYLGPVRVLVIDSCADFSRAGDALRGGAVGYSRLHWNRRDLLKLVDSCEKIEPPDRIAIDRRFGSWRDAV
jgi:hypothetical protein